MNKPIQNFNNDSLHRIKAILYIYATYIKRNWGSLFLILVGVIFTLAYALPYTVSLAINKRLAASSFPIFQTQSNYAFLYGSLSGLSLTIGSFVFRTYTSMRYNVMYKRIGLLGIKSTDFVIAYWICAIIFTIITIITNLLTTMMAMGITWSKLPGATSNQFAKIIFNKNLIINLIYIFIATIILTGTFLIINSIFLNPAIGYWLPSTLFCLVILLFLLVSLIPSFTSGFNASWIGNTYDFKKTSINKTEGISTWAWYSQLIYFIFIIGGGFIFALWSSWLAIKKFKWAN